MNSWKTKHFRASEEIQNRFEIEIKKRNRWQPWQMFDEEAAKELRDLLIQMFPFKDDK